VAAPDTLAPLRRVVPPYSLNGVTAAVLPTALADREYRDWYLREAAESRQLLADACARLGLETWPSAANFMLVNAGDRAADLARRLAERRIAVRDKSAEPGTRGCLRMTTGTVEHTRRLVTALEEVLCAGPR
jgi:histidinol-phosphate aminotransferase